MAVQSTPSATQTDHDQTKTHPRYPQPFRYPGSPWLVCGAAVGYGAASGVYGKDWPTKAYPQGTLRRQDAARGVDGGPEHAARNADRPRSN